MAEQAQEIVIDVKINTDEVSQKLSDAIQATANYKKEAAELRKEIQAGNDVDGKKAEQLAEIQKLIEANSRTVKSNTAILQAATQGNVSNTQSLDEQRQALNTLQKAYASLSGAEREAADRNGGLRDKIRELSDSVKAQEAAIGDSRRNVGNYTNSIVEAFGRSGGAAAKVINPVKNVTAGFKALSTTPAIFIIGLLAQLINKVVESLKKNEQAFGAVSSAMSIFSGVGVVVQRVLDKLAEGLVWLAEKLGKFAERLGLVNETMKESKAIAEAELQLSRERREFLYKEADAEREVAELRNKVAQTDKYTAEERLNMLKQAIAIEKSVADQRRKFAKEEYELIKRRNAQTASSAEDKQKEAEAYARMQKAETDYLNTTIKLQKQVATLGQEITAEMVKQQTELQELQATVDNFLYKSMQPVVKSLEELEKLSKALPKIAEMSEEEFVAPLTAFQKQIAELMKAGYTFADAQKIVAAQMREEWAGAAADIAGGFATAFGAISDMLGEYSEQSEAAATASKVFGMAGVLASEAQTIADGVRGVAAAVAAGAGLIFPANLGAIATGVAAVTSTIAGVISGIQQAKRLLSDTPKFERGGIVPGTSYTGDNVTVRANSGEMYLTRAQQARLLEIANGRGAADYDAMEAAMTRALMQMPAPVMVYREFQQFERQTAKIKEFATI